MHGVLVSIHKLPFSVYKHKKEIKDEQSLEVDAYKLLSKSSMKKNIVHIHLLNRLAMRKGNSEHKFGCLMLDN